MRKYTSVCNGVDAEGNPFHFTPDMLKPSMRVVTKGAGTFLVINPYSDAVCMHNGSIHIRWYETETSDFCRPALIDEIPYIVDEVYEAPAELDSFVLGRNAFGKILWKRKELKTVDSSIQKRLDYFKIHIDAVKENLESLQSEFEELQRAIK